MNQSKEVKIPPSERLTRIICLAIAIAPCALACFGYATMLLAVALERDGRLPAFGVVCMLPAAFCLAVGVLYVAKCSHRWALSWFYLKPLKE